MKKLKVAVVGCGAISKNHGEALIANENTEILYCVDLKKDKAIAFSEKYSGEPLTDYKELINCNDVDVVHICTPHFTHPEIAIEMLNSKKHVFCEKPLAITSSDGNRMIEAADKNDRYLGVCFQNRLNESSIEVKRILEEKKHGNIVSVMARVAWDRHGKYYTESDWRGSYDTEGGGCIINQSIHTIDLLDYLCGDVEAVTAVAMKFRDTDDYEVDDSCMANFQLANNSTAVGHFTNCYTKGKVVEIEIICEDATIVLTQNSYCEKINGKEFKCEVAGATGEKSEWGSSHAKIISEFYDSILEERPFFTDGRSANKTVKIIEAIKKSKGKPIDIA